MSVSGWVLVGLAGGFAAWARYLIDAGISRRTESDFPIGITLVNVLGALLLGLVAGSTLHGQALVIVAGGAIGSFTTFSTWMLDTRLLTSARSARFAWLNVVIPLVLGFAAVTLGHNLA